MCLWFLIKLGEKKKSSEWIVLYLYVPVMLFQGMATLIHRFYASQILQRRKKQVTSGKTDSINVDTFTPKRILLGKYTNKCWRCMFKYGKTSLFRNYPGSNSRYHPIQQKNENLSFKLWGFHLRLLIKINYSFQILVWKIKDFFQLLAPTKYSLMINKYSVYNT